MTVEEERESERESSDLTHVLLLMLEKRREGGDKKRVTTCDGGVAIYREREREGRCLRGSTEN